MRFVDDERNAIFLTKSRRVKLILQAVLRWDNSLIAKLKRGMFVSIWSQFLRPFAYKRLEWLARRRFHIRWLRARQATKGNPRSATMKNSFGITCCMQWFNIGAFLVGYAVNLHNGGSITQDSEHKVGDIRARNGKTECGKVSLANAVFSSV